MATHPDPQPNTGTASRGSLTDRKGYNERFLGPVLPLPLPTDSGTETVILPYTNFSVVFRPELRLAVATAVTIDGAHLIDVPREDESRFAPRLPEAQQGEPSARPRRTVRPQADRVHRASARGLRSPVPGHPGTAALLEGRRVHAGRR